MVQFRPRLALAAAVLACSSVSSAALPGNKPKIVSGSGSSHAGSFTAGSEGAEYEICGNGRMKLAAGTEIRLFRVPQRLPLAGGKRVLTWSLLLRSGRVDVTLPDADAQRCAVLVSAPRKLSALVLSGHAIATPEAVANVHGELLASTGENFQPLAPTQKKSLDGKTSELLPESGGIHGARTLVSIGRPASARYLSWLPVDGARAYAVSLHAAGSERPLARTRTTQPQLESALGELAPGRYELRVHALDANGFEGRLAQAELSVIGAELPPGSFVDARGTIRLAEGQRVRFTNVAGLEMTYGAAGRYVRASGDVGLYRDAPTSVHFRVPGTLQTVTARLAPRAIEARVHAGPKTARWPSDPLKITVDLSDVPDWLEPKATVTLGIEPIDVEWQRRGRSLVATIEPRASQGPWVVRVDVEDRFGLPLGRDFVEIAPDKKPARSRIAAAPRRDDTLSAR